MKTTASFLRNCICALVLMIVSTNAFSETVNPSNTTIRNLHVAVQNNNLVINWMLTESVSANFNYCEVQSSKDGITFTTIGMVMGADPKSPGSFSFKQNIAKMKAGKFYYRILTVENNGSSSLSNVINTAN